MVGFTIGATLDNVATPPVLTVSGVGVDPDLIEPIGLEINSGAMPNMLTLKVHKSFDDLDWFEWGSQVVLKADGKTIFVGVLLDNQPAYSMGDDSILLSIPDVTWIVDGQYIEFDVIGRTPGEIVTLIFGGDWKDSTFEGIVNKNYLTLASDPSILGNRYMSYQFSGIPVFQGISDLVKQCGNFLTYVTYSGTKAKLHIVERHTGSPRKLTLGNYGSNDKKADTISITGARSAMDLVNRYIGRGDRIITEVTNTGTYGEPITMTQEWDSALNAATLAKPQLTYTDSKYAGVGRRYRADCSELDMAGFMPYMASYASKSKTAAGQALRNQALQLFYRESQNSAEWLPFNGNYTIERVPALSTTLGGERNNAAGLIVVFESPQCYKKTADSETAFVAFRDFRLTFSHRSQDRRASKNYGRITSDSGKFGSFPIERKRLVRAPNYKYISRKSYREQYDTDGSLSGITFQSRTIKDDRARLKDWMKRLAEATGEPKNSFRIDILTNKAPDVSFWPGQRITGIDNCRLPDIDWDIIGVYFDFRNGITSIMTDDLKQIRGEA